MADSFMTSITDATQGLLTIANQPVTSARKAFLQGLENNEAEKSDSTLKDLYEKMAEKDPIVPFSLFDIFTETLNARAKYLTPAQMRTMFSDFGNINDPIKQRWPDSMYVYQDYVSSLPLVQVPTDHKYIDEISVLSHGTAGAIFADFAAKKGNLISYLSSKLKEPNQEKISLRSGVFIHFEATNARIGRMGSVTFSPRVDWNTLQRFDLNAGQSLQGRVNTKAYLELTVDELVGQQFEPLTNYVSRSFPLHESDMLARENARFTRSGALQTGEKEHSFFAHAGRTYRLGVHARAEMSYDIGNNGQSIANAATLLSMLEMQVSAIKVKSTSYMR
jgi:hypothetical protein